MEKQVIFFYSNTPVVRYNNRYYAKTKNFIDFLSNLAKQDISYYLLIPCRVVSFLPKEGSVLIDLPENIIEVYYYKGHFMAIIYSFLNALRLLFSMKKMIDKRDRLTIAGPGPNSFLFWISLFVPRSVDFAFFIRGDTVMTLRSIYKNNFFYSVIITLVKIFIWRINKLIKQERAKIFLFGEELRYHYFVPGKSMHVITPLIDENIVRIARRPDIKEDHILNVLYLGRLSKEKNVISLIEAHELSHSKKVPFNLTIVGYGSMENVINDKIDNISSHEKIKYLGYIPYGDSLIDLLDRNDLLCLPSLTEGVPRVVIESFARGMPVLATKVGSLQNYFPKEIKYLDGYDKDSILRGIAWCNSNRAKLSYMGKLGKNRLQRFLIKENVTKVDKILRYTGKEKIHKNH